MMVINSLLVKGQRTEQMIMNVNSSENEQSTYLNLRDHHKSTDIKIIT